MADGNDTLLDRPAPRTRPAPVVAGPGDTQPSLAPGSHATVSSPLDALARDEVLRSRNFTKMAVPVVVSALVAMPFMPGGAFETGILLSGLGVGAVAMLYLYHRTRDPVTFHRGRGVAISWFVAVASANTAIPYFGPYSPAPILALIGIYFIALGQSRALAIAIYVLCAFVQVASAGVVIAGIANPGIVHPDPLTIQAQIMSQGLVQVLFGAAFYVARASRRAQLEAIDELQDAIRAVAQRDALLQEAREELRRALGTGRGRFSEQTLGHYRLGNLLGRGAMGEVYDGIDVRTERPVAVKMLTETSLGNAGHVQRFLRELRTAPAIDSDNVVRVLDVGEQPLPHLVMERLEGQDLSALLREKRVLPIPKVVDLARQLGAGITAAADLGIIHRDLKPQNVFLAGATWKILDFGVSRFTNSGDTLTAGHLIGTPVYMAPEQARGQQVDHRADLYALAAIAYRCLTGCAPFSSGEITDVLYRVVHTAPRRPTSLARLPDDFDAVLAIGLAKQPAQRFASADELANALADAAAGRLPDNVRTRAHAIDRPWADSTSERSRAVTAKDS